MRRPRFIIEEKRWNVEQGAYEWIQVDGYDSKAFAKEELQNWRRTAKRGTYRGRDTETNKAF